MTTIVLNVSRLTLLQKLAKGQDIITKSTNNPNVPGNTASLAAFVTAQAALNDTNAAVEAHRQTGVTLHTARENALAVWLASLQGLAGTTQANTNGDAEKYESAGFTGRAGRTTPHPVVQVENVKVSFTGMPGALGSAVEAAGAVGCLCHRAQPGADHGDELDECRHGERSQV